MRVAGAGSNTTGGIGDGGGCNFFLGWKLWLRIIVPVYKGCACIQGGGAIVKF